MYDVVPTLPFDPNQVRAALPVGGKFRIDEVSPRHLVDEAEGWGMPPRLALETVMSTLAALGEAAANDGGTAVAPSVRQVVIRQLGRVRALPPA